MRVNDTGATAGAFFKEPFSDVCGECFIVRYGPQPSMSSRHIFGADDVQTRNFTNKNLPTPGRLVVDEMRMFSDGRDDDVEVEEEGCTAGMNCSSMQG